jgi:hypothetical protein
MDYHLEQALETVEYDNADELKKVLLGRRIVSVNRTHQAEIIRATYFRQLAAFEQGVSGAVEPYKPYDLDRVSRSSYDEVIEYHLDNGWTLRAHANDGGCACSNGCFSVDLSQENEARLIGATILGVQVEETVEGGHYDHEKNEYVETPTVYINGEGETPSDGSSSISVFVYTDLTAANADGERIPLVESEGGDNGYYGWGFSFSVDRTIIIGERDATTAEAVIASMNNDESGDGR